MMRPVTALVMAAFFFGGLFLGHNISVTKANVAYDTNFVCPRSYDPNWWCKPPIHIRVKRVATGKVELIDFIDWMQNTLPKEINCKVTAVGLRPGGTGDHFTQATIDASTLALKMFGWARHLARSHYTPGNDRPVMNYDVTDDKSDGAYYIPGSATTECNAAIDRMNGIMMVRNYTDQDHGRIFEAGWRSGTYISPISLWHHGDILQQWNSEYQIDHGHWRIATYPTILNWFYAHYHIHYY